LDVEAAARRSAGRAFVAIAWWPRVGVENASLVPEHDRADAVTDVELLEYVGDVRGIPDAGRPRLGVAAFSIAVEEALATASPRPLARQWLLAIAHFIVVFFLVIAFAVVSVVAQLSTLGTDK
jgi:hypothetical protein